MRPPSGVYLMALLMRFVQTLLNWSGTISTGGSAARNVDDQLLVLLAGLTFELLDHVAQDRAQIDQAGLAPRRARPAGG